MFLLTYEGYTDSFEFEDKIRDFEWFESEEEMKLRVDDLEELLTDLNIIDAIKVSVIEDYII